MRYRVLAEAMRKRQGNRKAIVEKVRAAIQSQLAKDSLPADVSGREKSLYGIYRKNARQVAAVRAGVRRLCVPHCHRPGRYLLPHPRRGAQPLQTDPRRFKDYIAIPKANGYQSLHTVVFGPFGLSIEVQIRTREMHRVAEAGVAAHWLYKSSEPGGTDTNQQHALTWLHDLLAIQSEAGNANEFLDHLKVDLFPDEVYVSRRTVTSASCRAGATVIDFAYDVHTDIGKPLRRCQSEPRAGTAAHGAAQWRPC